MVELKEFRTDSNELIFKENLVRSSILPQNTRELSRNVIIQDNVIMEGAVFGERIDITGGEVQFKGAVYANSEIHINNEVTGKVFFEKAVACSDTVAAFITSGRVYFGSDINAPKVRLKNCYVGGSIFSQEAYLENCIVLGGVFASKQSVISNCIVGTFHAPAQELAGVNYLLYPAGFCTEPLTFLPGTELYNLSLAHLGALFKGEPEDENTGKIRMDLENDHQKSTLVGDDGVNTIVNTYSVSGRVLAADIIDMEKLENHFLIGAGALGTQILKTYNLAKKDGSRSEDLTVENIADFFFNILLGRIQVRDLSGEISFADLKMS